MKERLISGDNHIDLTYLPTDLWSSQAPGKWKLLVPRVEELEDGLHWFVEGQDQGMWNGVGPARMPHGTTLWGIHFLSSIVFHEPRTLIMRSPCPSKGATSS